MEEDLDIWKTYIWICWSYILRMSLDRPGRVVLQSVLVVVCKCEREVEWS